MGFKEFIADLVGRYRKPTEPSPSSGGQAEGYEEGYKKGYDEGFQRGIEAKTPVARVAAPRYAPETRSPVVFR